MILSCKRNLCYFIFYFLVLLDKKVTNEDKFIDLAVVTIPKKQKQRKATVLVPCADLKSLACNVDKNKTLTTLTLH